MHVLIPGGSGLIGTVLTAWLVRHRHEVTVLSRQPNRAATAGVDIVQWDGKSEQGIVDCVNRADAIVNLAGAGIADRRWTQAYKSKIQRSRTDAAQALVRAIAMADRKPAAYVQASAVGFYGSFYRGETLTENLPAGTDFLARVCRDWEDASKPVADWGVRVTQARIGIVLSRQGGALTRMLPPFRLGLGGAMGDGKQPFPWIHVQDVAGALAFLALNEKTQGAYNLTAPHIISNREFSCHLAQTLRRPMLFDIPAVAVQLLFGELAVILVHGQNAVSRKLREAGFSFQYTDAQTALAQLLA